VKARRADQRQGSVASAVELGIQQQEGQAAEMIGVQVRHEDRTDAVWVDAEPPHGDEAGRAAVDQKCGAPGFDEKAGVEPTAAAERIATAEKLQLH
jgi:hypothetical protein